MTDLDVATITIAMNDRGLLFRFEGVDGTKTKAIAARMLELLKADLSSQNIEYHLDDPAKEETVRQRIERLIHEHPPDLMRLRLLIDCEVPERDLPDLAAMIEHQQIVVVQYGPNENEDEYEGPLMGAQQVHVAT